MKQLSLMIVLAFALVILLACGSRVSVTQPAIVNDSLDTSEAYLRRGDDYSEIKDYGLAISDYNQAILLKPDYAEAYNNRGYAYYWKGDSTDAIADHSQAILLRPNYAYAFNNRGAAYMASGHPDQAISDFNRAIQLQADFSQAYTNRGNAYLRKGRIDLAIADFLQAGQNPVGLIFPVAVVLFLAIAVSYIIIWGMAGIRRRAREMR